MYIKRKRERRKKGEHTKRQYLDRERECVP